LAGFSGLVLLIGIGFFGGFWFGFWFMVFLRVGFIAEIILFTVFLSSFSWVSSYHFLFFS